ncbi:oxidoreductase-like protein [Lentithecium fluviatile CBS 122367]|uniref:Oxidoreductase-like protein n=1 Tax=Lentithecium fluviatile CBS 122367 TaxID=1168545 RepID=A0A6G1J0G4_9PLEO|nr:oxidoreductase-like protein [Lentithecium fluviatile CBS 122367]
MSQDPEQPYLNNGANFTPTTHHTTYPTISPRTNLKFGNKNVFITGASKGIGRATAISFAKAGASCIALGARSSFELHNVEEEVHAAAKAAGRTEPMVMSIFLDVTDRNSVEDAVRQVEYAFLGRLDILVNNAGYLAPLVGLPESDPDEWWKEWEVNVKGTYLVTRAFWKMLMASSHKVVINLTSIAAHMLLPHATAYGSSKLALIRFTESLDHDYGPHSSAADGGIVAHAVYPGSVRTELSQNMPSSLHGLLTDEPALPADTMVWLCSERRTWLSGRYVSVDWDMAELEAKREEVVKGDLLKVRMAVNAFPHA